MAETTPDDATTAPDAAGSPRTAGARLRAASLGLALAAAAAGAGFYATNSGRVPEALMQLASIGGKDAPAVFVPIEPIVVSLPPGAGGSHLKVTAELEVAPGAAGRVESLRPRVLDVLNTYLHAVEPARFEEAGALMRLRAHMLHRVKVVVGAERVRDLLVTEFVVN